MPLWCCTHMRCGAAGHCTRQWTSWAMGSWVSSGGTCSARMPSPRCAQLAPASSVNQMPPVETATHTRLRIARVDADRMDARQVGAAAHPLLALGMIPERADHLPALPVIGRAEQAARQRAAPDDAGLVGAAGRERPDARRAPVERPAPHVVLLVAFRLRRIGGSGDLLPAVRGRAVQLDAEVAMIERRIAPPVAPVGQREGDVVAEEIDAP